MVIDIRSRILCVRGQRVLLDQDLAFLYGVTVKRLNEKVRRNIRKFQPGGLVLLEPEEANFLRSHFATFGKGRSGHRKHAHLVFTAQGAMMVAALLRSDRALQVSLQIHGVIEKLNEVPVRRRPDRYTPTERTTER
jgi:ORF6N domain